MEWPTRLLGLGSKAGLLFTLNQGTIGSPIIGDICILC